MYYARSRYRPFLQPRVGQDDRNILDQLLYGATSPRPPFPDPTPIEQTPLGEQQPLPPSPEEQLAASLARDIRTSLSRAQAPGGGSGVPVVVRPRPSPLGPPPTNGGGLQRPAPGAGEAMPVTPTPVETGSILRTIGETLLLTSPAWGSYLYTRYFG